MWVMNLVRFSYMLAHAASDGKVTQAEILEALKAVFPDDVDKVLEELKDEDIGVDDVVRLVAAIVS